MAELFYDTFSFMKEDLESQLSLGLDGQTIKPSKIAIVRHGDYGKNEGLTFRGEQQITNTGEKLRMMISPEELGIILSSPAQRAIGSAEILSGILNSPLEIHDLLYSDASKKVRLEAAQELILASGKDLVVVVTHCEYGDTLPSYLTRGFKRRFWPGLLDCGKGVLIDRHLETLVKL